MNSRISSQVADKLKEHIRQDFWGEENEDKVFILASEKSKCKEKLKYKETHSCPVNHLGLLGCSHTLHNEAANRRVLNMWKAGLFISGFVFNRD